MSTRTNYHQIAEKINYASLEKKLDLLRAKEPPKSRESAADVLAPIAEKLCELKASGWSYIQLAKELNEGGLTVKVSALRSFLGKELVAARPRPSGTRPDQQEATDTAPTSLVKR